MMTAPVSNIAIVVVGAPAMAHDYDAFISYSHAADARLAPALESGLQRLAKPWYRLRALRLFRDQTNLGVRPDLWPSIRAALERSRYLVLLASPEGARSKWVRKEVDSWLTTRPLSTILIVVTDGELQWDGAANSFDPSSTAIPPRLLEEFSEEPIWLDLRWARSQDQLSLRHSRFRSAVCQLAATLRDVTPDQLDGDDIRLHRQTRRIATAAALALAVLAGLASLQTVRERSSRQEAQHQSEIAMRERDQAQQERREAEKQRNIAVSQEKRADQQRDIAVTQESLAIRRQREAMEQQKIAATERDLARSREASSRGIAALTVDPERALRLGLDAAAFAPTAEAEDTLRQGLARSYSRGRLTPVKGSIDRVAIGTDGRAAVRTATGLEIWNITTKRLVARVEGRVIDSRLSSDGRMVVTASQHGAEIFALADAREIATLKQPGIRGVDFAPNDQSILILKDDGSIAKWPFHDASGMSQALIKTDHGQFIVSGHTQILASTEGQRVAVWSLKDGSRLATLTGRPDGYARLEFSSDDRLLLGYGALDNREAGVWDWQSQRHIEGFFHSDTVRAAAVSPDGRRIATGDEDGHTRIYDATNGKLLHELIGHMAAVRQVAFSPRGELLLSASTDQTARVWDVHSGQSIAQLLGHGAPIMTAAFDPEGKFILTGAADGSARLWDVVGSHPEYSLQVCNRATGSLADEIDQDVHATFEAVGSAIRTVVAKAVARWDMRTGQKLGQPAEVGSARQGRYQPIVGARGEVRAVDTETGRVLWSRTFGSTVRTTLSDGARFVVSGDRPPAIIVDGRTGRPLAEIASTVQSGWFVSGQKKLIAGTSVFDLETGARIGQLTGHVRGVSVVTVSQDGRVILTAGPDGTAMLRDGSTLEVTGELRGHGQGIRAAAFSPDGLFVITAAEDRTARVWEVTSRRTLLTLRGHDSPVTSAAFSPDGKWIVTGGSDCRALVYPWDLGGSLPQLVQIAKQRLLAIGRGRN
jgi:WD40 repeat protein